MAKNGEVSASVIKRLPRYYRFLGELMKQGTERISSRELASLMKLTASQIRQDLNCFGGFGQQGYGYNVKDLHEQIGKILGVDRSTVSQWERGENKPRVDVLLKLASVFRCSVDTLLRT